VPLTRKHLFELTVEILIGVALVAVVILYTEVGPFPWMPSVRWWGLAGTTGLLLWFAIRRYRRHWRQRSFWLNLTWLTALHLATWAVVLANVTVWGLLWFVPPLTVEAGLLVLVLHGLGYDPAG
jgi:hypothetical protein